VEALHPPRARAPLARPTPRSLTAHAGRLNGARDFRNYVLRRLRRGIDNGVVDVDIANSQSGLRAINVAHPENVRAPASDQRGTLGLQSRSSALVAVPGQLLADAETVQRGAYLLGDHGHMCSKIKVSRS
jgi:hypothetical protein